ncbi:uncharacterized protein G2W53_036642 [Senna tora]|uniref:Uncharacterized protein n=1 Tax=Senna tora TaxID=362788 RepID=A0A834WAF1_9FABA|nr:uncharacterized protein G2W53_036642 [Senna tora]
MDPTSTFFEACTTAQAKAHLGRIPSKAMAETYWFS